MKRILLLVTLAFLFLYCCACGSAKVATPSAVEATPSFPVSHESPEPTIEQMSLHTEEPTISATPEPHNNPVVKNGTFTFDAKTVFSAYSDEKLKFPFI